MPPSLQNTAVLGSMWDRYRPLMLARLDVLERSASDNASPELREEATVVAHNLSGSLGMFGFPEGTRLARELEEVLDLKPLDQARMLSLCHLLRENLFGSSSQA